MFVSSETDEVSDQMNALVVMLSSKDFHLNVHVPDKKHASYSMLIWFKCQEEYHKIKIQYFCPWS